MTFAKALIVFFLITWSQALWGLDYNRYHTQTEINAYLRQVSHEHPTLIQHHVLGRSAQGREISYIIISKNNPATVPAIFLNGTHHGNEKSSTEATLGVLDFFINNQHTVDVDELLQSYAIYIQPLVNPDGHFINSRYDSGGRDPNRDYSSPLRNDLESFKVPAVQLVKQLSDEVRFHAAVAYHSGMEAVLWPWCHTPEKNGDHQLFYTLAKKSALAMGMNVWAQSYFDYPTQGEFTDYAYWSSNTIALTFEVSQERTPNKTVLPNIVERSIAGTMAFLYGVMAYDRGILELEDGPSSQIRVVDAR